MKFKYEAHHGVRITDGAVVAAAKLGDRYITSRFLPDKAIDLMDEACAVVRVELDSEPAVLDSVKRRRFQLQVEAAALRAEEGLDALSTERLVAVKAELEELNVEQKKLEEEYTAAKAILGRLADTRREIEDTQWAIEENERKLRVEKAADLRYGELPQLQQRYQALEEQLLGLGSLVADSVGAQQVAEIVSRWTGIPVTRLSRSEAERMMGLQDRLAGRVVGQHEAVKAVAAAVLRARAGLGAGEKPVGSFLFLGPTGVGKTELAKALAAELFDDEKQIVRLDMSEYLEQHSISRLIGSPPGYIGHDDGGQLTEAVRRRPWSVVLFDEVEKAHPSIWNTLLQLLDEGRLTDGKGRLVDFKQTVVILTSNLAADQLLEDVAAHGEITAVGKAAAQAAVRRHFRPEFLNRLDKTVLFSPLNEEALRTILMHSLKLAADREGLADRQITVSLDPLAVDAMINEGYDPAYGARPLRRLLDESVLTDLSVLIMSGQLNEQQDVVIGWEHGELSYTVDGLVVYASEDAEERARQNVMEADDRDWRASHGSKADDEEGSASGDGTASAGGDGASGSAGKEIMRQKAAAAEKAAVAAAAAAAATVPPPPPPPQVYRVVGSPVVRLSLDPESLVELGAMTDGDQIEAWEESTDEAVRFAAGWVMLRNARGQPQLLPVGAPSEATDVGPPYPLAPAAAATAGDASGNDGRAEL